MMHGIVFANQDAFSLLEKRTVKGKWQQNFLLSHLKETPKQYTEVCYRILISALFGEIF